MTTADTAGLVEVCDIRSADDADCGVVISWTPSPPAYVVTTIETGTQVARTGSVVAAAAHTAAALIAYGADGQTGYGSWAATVTQGREILDDLDDFAADLESLARDLRDDEVTGSAWEIVASDRHGYGHQPERYNGVPGTRDAAIADARDRYGKATGLDAADIAIRVLN